MKKNLLFVIDSLDCAGAEKSLVTLLGLLNYEKYSVDLMLFAHGKELEKFLPEEVNILQPLKYTAFSRLGLQKAFFNSVKDDIGLKMLYARLQFSSLLRKKKFNNAQKARIFWQCTSKVIEKNEKVYDIAISYAQGVPTFYVAEKVKAKQKFAWVNVSYKLDETEKEFQKNFYDQYNKIISVSPSTKDIFLENYPHYIDKLEVIHDINNPHFISRMAGIGDSYSDGFDGMRILTIGRIAHQKGYDIALEACKQLKEKGIKFRWYALGKGPLEKTIRAAIEEKGLADHFILLGVEANPYPFIKNSDIYVQTSRFEGFGIAIAEARMLNIPVVTTRFDAVFTQMVNGKNGLVVDMNAKSVYEGILKLYNDKGLKSNITDYLKTEKKGNIEEIQKFYKLMG